MFKAAIVLSQQYNITFQGQFLTYEEILTDDDIMVTINHTCHKVSTSNIVGFVGPAYSCEARYIASFAYRLGILDVSYSATNPDLSTINTRAFFRVVPSDENTALGIKILFQQYKWKSCIIIYQNDEYGYNGVQLLSQKFSEVRIKAFETIKFDINQQRFQIDFKTTLLNSLSRVVVVWANEKSMVAILNKAFEDDLMNQHFVWILTTTISLKYFNERQQQNLVGILTIEPAQGDFVDATINTTLLNEAYEIWKFYEPNTFPGNINVSSYALFAFDATWSLILSLQRLCSMESSCLELMNVSDCYNRRFLHSEQYYNIMKTMTFSGVSGRLEFSNETSDRIDSIYYIIKNIQPLSTAQNNIDYIPVLQWDVNSTKWRHYTNGSADILWPNRSKSIPIHYRLIRGQKLRIAIIESPPSVILKNSTTMYKDMIENYKKIDLTDFDGFYKDLLVYLQSRMGFIPVIMLAKPAIRFDELVDGVANDSFDIVMCSIDANAKRNQIVDFSTAIMPGSYRIVIRKPNIYQSNYPFLLEKFSPTICLFLLIIITYNTILICLVEQKNENNKNENSFVGITMIIKYSIGFPNITSQSRVKKDIGQMITRILSIVQTIVLVLCIAVFVLSLIIENSKHTISGIDDIKNGKVPPNRIGIVVGSQIEEYYLNSVSQGKKDYYPLKTTDEVYTRLIQGDIDASLWSNISTTYQVNNVYCDLMTVGVEFSHSFYQIPVKKGWLYTADLNFNILSFMESEEFDRISAKWFRQHQCSKTNLFNTEANSAAIRILFRLFITLATIIIIPISIQFWSRRSLLINIINRVCRKKRAILPPSTTVQFVLIDLSTRLNELAFAMLDALCSLAKDSILNFENSSTFNFDELPKRTTILFVSSEFAATIQNEPKYVETTIFILEDDKNKVDNRKRFATGEDLIFQLADELYRCYKKEAEAYLKSSDSLTAKIKEEQANQIHSELKKIHKRLFARNITTNTLPCTETRLVWLKSKLQHDVEVEKVKKLFSEVVSSFSVFDNRDDCYKNVFEQGFDGNIFLIIDTDYDDSVVADYEQHSNVRIVGRYGQSSPVNETVIDSYYSLCSRLACDLIVHYNNLGTEYSGKQGCKQDAKQRAKTAKDMFQKAYKLCQIEF